MITFNIFPEFRFNTKRIHKFIFLVLLIKIYGSLILKVGVVNATVNSSISFVFSMLKIEEFFPIYYVIARDKKRKLYWINIVLYSLLNLVQGWTGFILTIGFIELYFAIKANKINEKWKTFMPLGVPMILLFGAGIYKFAYPFKWVIRYGGKFSYYRVTFFQSLNKLVERLSNFPLQIIACQNEDTIIDYYRASEKILPEIQCMLRPLVPSFLMPDKDIRPINNLIIKSIYSKLNNKTGSGFGIVMYCKILSKANIMDFFVYIFLLILIFVFISSILKGFDNEENDISIIYYMLLTKLCMSASLEQVFSFGYFGALYMLAIMIFFRVIEVKIYKKRKYK